MTGTTARDAQLLDRRRRSLSASDRLHRHDMLPVCHKLPCWTIVQSNGQGELPIACVLLSMLCVCMCVCTRVLAFHIFPFYSLSDCLLLSNTKLSAVCPAGQKWRWNKGRGGKKKTGTWCSALSEISSSLLTFGFTHLIFMSDKVHKHTLQVEELGKLHTCIHAALASAFWMNLRKGREDVTSSLWSMEDSLTLSVLVLSDESSQMGDFFF